MLSTGCFFLDIQVSCAPVFGARVAIPKRSKSWSTLRFGSVNDQGFPLTKALQLWTSSEVGLDGVVEGRMEAQGQVREILEDLGLWKCGQVVLVGGFPDNQAADRRNSERLGSQSVSLVHTTEDMLPRLVWQLELWLLSWR